MELVQRRCCGIDVHKKKLMVHVLPPQGRSEAKSLEREFRTFTRDLRDLRQWLKECEVTEVVMEATGQYWRPVWNVLEDDISRLMLVNPQHVKALAGRKTDRIDSRRLARYLERGELVGSFIPPRPIRELRDLTRYRIHLVEEVNRVKNRISALCETGNIKVSSVATDLFGVSGRRMLQAVAGGDHEPCWMADYAQGRLRRKLQELTLALEGDFTECQRWMLREELAHLKFLEREISKLEAEIASRMQPRRADPAPDHHSGREPDRRLDDPRRTRFGHEGISRCAACRQLGRHMPRQWRECRQTDKRTTAERKSVFAAGLMRSGLGGEPYQRNVLERSVQEVHGTAWAQYGHLRCGPSDSDRRLPNAASG